MQPGETFTHEIIGKILARYKFSLDLPEFAVTELLTFNHHYDF
jgi:hypothetical protein